MPIYTQTGRPVLEIAARLDLFDTLDLMVHRGDFVLAQCPNRDGMARVSRIAGGMQLLEPGKARFMDDDWATVDSDRASRLRGSLGVAPLRAAWIAHQTLLQNLMLAPLHHGARSRAAIIDEAASLCRKMGLPGVPLLRPENASADDLSRAAIARAFMGDKRLVILEEPDAAMMAPVVNLCRELCRRGGAVLWMTTNLRFFERPPFTARQLRLGQRREETTA